MEHKHWLSTEQASTNSHLADWGWDPGLPAASVELPLRMFPDFGSCSCGESPVALMPPFLT